MSKFINIVIIMSLLFSLTNINSLAKGKRRATSAEVKGETNTEIVSQAEEGSEQDGDFEKNLPSYETFVQSMNNARDVIDNIEKFIKDSDNKLETYKFLNSEDRRILSEELSDLNTRSAQIKDDIDSIQLDNFNEDMPKQTDELTQLNNDCLELNDKHKEILIDKLLEAYVNEHKDFVDDSQAIYEEYPDFFDNKKQIEDLLDESDDMQKDISPDSSEDDWGELQNKETELINLINSEANKYK